MYSPAPGSRVRDDRPPRPEITRRAQVQVNRSGAAPHGRWPRIARCGRGSIATRLRCNTLGLRGPSPVRVRRRPLLSNVVCSRAGLIDLWHIHGPGGVPVSDSARGAGAVTTTRWGRLARIAVGRPRSPGGVVAAALELCKRRVTDPNAPAASGHGHQEPLAVVPSALTRCAESRHGWV